MKWLSILCAAIVVHLISAIAPPTQATTSRPFKGITLHQLTLQSPRALKINVVEIDLNTPGIRFHVTPSNGEQPGETTLQTTRDFLVEQRAQLAINASFYKIIENQFGDTSGLTASDGVVYSDPELKDFPTMNISRDNAVSFITDSKPAAPATQLYNAVSGKGMILVKGRNVAKDERLHPRVAIGIAPNHRLVILTVDGRQPIISEGMTTPEVGEVMLSFGVTDALNLDGGGSATLAIADPSPRLVNTPVGTRNIPGSQRKNASNLAVFANPIAR